MIVAIAGLPGCGKTTLARELAARTSGIILSKDEIRAALFPPEEIEYSTTQDDFCQEVMLLTAKYVLGRDPQRDVFFDGRTFSRRYQLEEVISAAEELSQGWRILELVCSEASARERLRQGPHLAANRDFDLYLRVQARFEPITFPKTVIDTDQPLEVCVQQAMRALEVDR